MGRCFRCLLASAAIAGAADAAAVSIGADGNGQALIYPFYTVRSNAGNAFNTYISIVNTRTSGKAVRVRFREARNGREAAAFNLFLPPSDVWTGALVPDGAGTRLVTSDRSCTQPAFGPLRGAVAPPQGFAFTTADYTGARADGAGDTVDRTREGYVEALEMAEIKNGALVAATHTSDGYPANCSFLGTIEAFNLGPPGGGLSGTYTLINVANGQDFTAAAEAMDHLSRQPYYRPVDDPYPGFTAAEIDPVSVIQSQGATYRSTWTRGLDAIHAVLTRHLAGEFLLDPTVASATDLVVTFPTRYAAVTAAGASAPFKGRIWRPECGPNSTLAPWGGEVIFGEAITRDASSTGLGSGLGILPSPADQLCGSANVLTLRRDDRDLRRVLGSASATYNYDFLGLRMRSGFESGWIQLSFDSISLVSGADSTRTDAATGQVTIGRHTYTGLPVVGLVARSITNGFLDCGGKLCQGNYGGSFPMSSMRAITP